MKPRSDKALWLIIFIITLILTGNFIFTQYEISQLRSRLTLEPVKAGERISPIASITPSPIASSSAIPSPAISPTIISVSSPAPKVNNQITYLPLTGGSTQNTDWTNIPFSQFTFNIGDYGSKPYVIWDANLRVDNANGTTYARIFDTTHGIAVNGSEINITDISASSDITSGSLSFWQGNNTYVIQLKSLNSSIAFMDSGRIKITY